MEKARLSDLKRKILIRSKMLAISSLDEIFGLDDNLSSDEILLEIIKEALREFEVTLPLIHEMRLNKGQMQTCYNLGPGWYEIKSNFTLYLDCKIAEDQIILVPTSIPKIRLDFSWPTAGAWEFATDYRRPFVFLGSGWEPYIMDQGFYMKGTCARPIIPDFTEDRMFNTESGKAAIYWMNIEEGAKANYFMDLCMVHVLDYIRQLKASVQLVSMPMEVMNNVDSAYAELRARCDNYALQSSWYGDLVD